MGERSLRRLLIIGASAVARWAARKGVPAGSWLGRMLTRKPPMLVRVALATKMARIVWALLARGGVGGLGPGFHALLTRLRPKHCASSRFCSHTVQAPAKPKPLRSHSITSNPWIVRRAVWKAWKQPIRGMGRLTRKWSLSVSRKSTGRAVLVDGPVQIPPLAADPNVRLVDAD